MTRNYSARALNRAQYLPAGQNGAHTITTKPATAIRGGSLPPFLKSTADLDWLDPANPFFYSDRALFSAGQFIGKTTRPGMFSKRPGVTILGDSGGLQYGRGVEPWQGNVSRQWTLNWLEANVDEAINLDIPTVAIKDNPQTFPTFAACLQTTVANNAYFQAHRTNLRVLSALQGTTSAEAVAWYDAVKAQPFEGWAFAGDLRDDYYHMGTMLVRLVGDGLLSPERNRIHVLGVSKLTDAVMLSAYQRALREHLQDDELQITFDTSSPSQMAMTGAAYGYPRLSPTGFRIDSFSPPSKHVQAAKAYRFAHASSRIAEVLTTADLIVPAATRQHGWDGLGNDIVTFHNVEAMFRAIADANAVLGLPTSEASAHAPAALVNAYKAARTMFRFPNPLTHLRMNQRYFAAI